MCSGSSRFCSNPVQCRRCTILRARTSYFLQPPAPPMRGERGCGNRGARHHTWPSSPKLGNNGISTSPVKVLLIKLCRFHVVLLRHGPLRGGIAQQLRRGRKNDSRVNGPSPLYVSGSIQAGGLGQAATTPVQSCHRRSVAPRQPRVRLAAGT